MQSVHAVPGAASRDVRLFHGGGACGPAALHRAPLDGVQHLRQRRGVAVDRRARRAGMRGPRGGRLLPGQAHAHAAALLPVLPRGRDRLPEAAHPQGDLRLRQAHDAGPARRPGQGGPQEQGRRGAHCSLLVISFYTFSFELNAVCYMRRSSS